MPTHHPTIPPAPQPTKIYFDPYHSSAIGHQIHASKLAGTTAWRDSRSRKLKHQFGDDTGGGGQQHLSDLIGAGSENFRKDGRKDNGDWERGAPGLRENGWQDIRSLMGGTRKRSCDSSKGKAQWSLRKRRKSNENEEEKDVAVTCGDVNQSTLDENNPQPEQNPGAWTEIPDEPRPIFRNLTIYVNGSTAPLVSDHKLKQLFGQHGGNTSLALARRTVTHVILGDTGGGGLSSSKIQKEVSTVRGKGIKYVNAQWILDSIERGVRQPEEKYTSSSVAKKIGGSGQQGVRQIFGANGGNMSYD